jgi:predicted ATPase
VRRNAYWRFFGLDLAFGTDDNRPPSYDKAKAANTSFISLFEELLFELWQAITNVRNTSGSNTSDDDRIFRIAEELRFVLRSRRQSQMLAREELAAATVLGWVDLTLSADTPVVVDLRAQATSPAERLRLIGERVGMPAHSRSSALFSMSADLSLFLRTIESGLVSSPELAWVLYLEQQPAGTTPAGTTPTAPAPIGAESRRVITEWAAATGKDLKARGKPIEANRRQLTGAR